MKKFFIILFLIAGNLYPVMSQTVLPLYPDKIPNSIKTANEEISDKNNPRPFILKVSQPTLTVFLPEKSKSTGTAVVICPGGGYSGLAIEHEGYEVAKEFNKIGVAAFVLKYRIPDTKTMQDKTIGPLQDAQQAIKMVRQRAKKWAIDAGKVGIMGFSAGGHLASTAGTHFNKAVIENKEGISLRPDFMILIYPVISFQDNLTHMGSRNNLIGENPPKETKDLYSNELQVNKETPPSFLVHAGDDDVVKVENSLFFYNSLHKAGVPAGMIIYPKGGHGFGLVNPTTDNRWFNACADWLKSSNLLKK
ncbi:alpha/beta hydrolase [Rubrolithibacter danxiaensis]|uniref:alpha/beta hydrolase n=1 Tax=Rubrolithibacter danxiaensis TaxID=3390805 RepID=UPI003BF7E3AA